MSEWLTDWLTEWGTDFDSGKHRNKIRESNLSIINLYLGSIITDKVAAAMVISPLLKWRQISHPALLAVLTHCGLGVVSSSDDYSATKVDSTGHTTINMLFIKNTSHLIITVYHISSQSCKLRSRPPLSSHWSWDCPNLPSIWLQPVSPSWSDYTC